MYRVFALLVAASFLLCGCCTLVGAAIGSAVPREAPVSGSPIGLDVRVHTTEGFFDGRVKSNDGKLLVLESGADSYELPLDRIQRLAERKSYADTGAAVGGVADSLIFFGGVIALVVAFSSTHVSGFGGM